MSIFITLIAALIVFSAVIAIHEFGHFAVAKLCGIQVNEFSIGMGPALWKKIYKGTQYSLRALPVGGYVALEGEAVLFIHGKPIKKLTGDNILDQFMDEIYKL